MAAPMFSSLIVISVQEELQPVIERQQVLIEPQTQIAAVRIHAETSFIEPDF